MTQEPFNFIIKRLMEQFPKVMPDIVRSCIPDWRKIK